MKQALLDSDTISFYFRNNQQVVEKVDKYLKKFGYIHISVITYYEIMNGLYYRDARNQMNIFRRFVELNEIIPLSTSTTEIAAKIYADLRKSGITIGHNDVMIGAFAIDNDMTLITNNEKHFRYIPGLEIDNWTK
ncbi:MAG: type II toxin-antitoxin system VapC family toxin [Bacteroidota bacterium]